ncbi:MAG: DUF4339 domain-containing protein [Simkania negevensis]|nr:DUF4339 domain-containing protein [Simkania negevensis]
MYIFLSMISGFIFGIICSYVAIKRGRNQIRWFVGGCLFGLLALLFLYLLPPVSKRKQREEKTPNYLLFPSEEERALFHPFQKKLWYYLDHESKQYGPMSFDALKKGWNEGKVQEKTYLWNEDLENWKLLEEMKEILAVIKNEPSPEAGIS